MTVDCLACDDEIDIGTGGEPHLTISARLGFRDSWNSYGRLHLECAKEHIGEGHFDVEAWAEGVSDK